MKLIIGNKVRKSLKTLTTGAAIISLSASSLMAVKKAHAATGTGAASAILLSPIDIDQTISGTLNFGSFAIVGSGTAQVDTANSRTTTGSLVPIGGAGLQQRGLLTLSALTNVPIEVSFLGAPGATFTVSNGTSTMIIGDFNIGTPTAGDQVTLSITASPINIPVGARLFAGPTQAAGTYTGNYTIIMNYQ